MKAPIVSIQLYRLVGSSGSPPFGRGLVFSRGRLLPSVLILASLVYEIVTIKLTSVLMSFITLALDDAAMVIYRYCTR